RCGVDAVCHRRRIRCHSRENGARHSTDSRAHTAAERSDRGGRFLFCQAIGAVRCGRTDSAEGRRGNGGARARERRGGAGGNGIRARPAGAGAARGFGRIGHQGRPDVSARARSRVRAQERSAAIRYPGSAGARNLPGTNRAGFGKGENHMNPSNDKAGAQGNPPAAGPSNFVRDIILEDLKTNKWGGRVHTRFPPEPNGYLHIGHAKSICLNFGLAAEFGGKTNLRFDDTNPEKEETEYVDSIMENVRWLGFDWEDRLFYASDYFGQLYEWAQQLIRAGKAYVCDLNAEEVRKYRGTLTEPGKESPYSNRSVEENL